MLALHNQARAGVSPPAATPLVPMVCDNELAALAQTHANGCSLGPESVRRTPAGAFYGQNFAAGSANFLPLNLAQLWIDNGNGYVLGAFSGAVTQAFYTQVIWSSSVRVGCGFASGCPTLSSFLVCNDLAVGNIVGQQPYQTS